MRARRDVKTIELQDAIVIDENTAPHVPQEIGTTCYHCPHTNCDGHFYLHQADLGIERMCPKCGLAVTVGKRTERPGQNWSATRILLALLFGACLGFLLGLAVMHY